MSINHRSLRRALGHVLLDEFDCAARAPRFHAKLHALIYKTSCDFKFGSASRKLSETSTVAAARH